MLANVLRYDAAVLADQRTKLEREVANSTTEIHHYAALVEIQCLDHVGWPLPSVSVAFDLLQCIKSLNAFIEIAQQENEQHSADQEQCYANTIRSLDTVIGYRRHVRNKKPYVAIRSVLIISQVKRRWYRLRPGGPHHHLETGPPLRSFELYTAN